MSAVTNRTPVVSRRQYHAQVQLHNHLETSPLVPATQETTLGWLGSVSRNKVKLQRKLSRQLPPEHEFNALVADNPTGLVPVEGLAILRLSSFS